MATDKPATTWPEWTDQIRCELGPEPTPEDRCWWSNVTADLDAREDQMQAWAAEDRHPFDPPRDYESDPRHGGFLGHIEDY